MHIGITHHLLANAQLLRCASALPWRTAGSGTACIWHAASINQSINPNQSANHTANLFYSLKQLHINIAQLEPASFLKQHHHHHHHHHHNIET
jgi:hypothetical protein